MERSMLWLGHVHLVQNSSPPERVVNSLEPAASEETPPSEESPYALTGAGVFSGNSRWIFSGIPIGAVIISIAGFIFSHSKAGADKAASALKLFNVATRSVSTSPHVVVTPPPVLVQIRPEMLRVTAISLGHPRLAVINGTPLAEGDFFLVHSSGNGVVVRLKVMKITDGRVDLQNGRQLICARLMTTEEKTDRPR